ncbi:Hypothetical_protein [Hexamita inflata]|uniref:Hypothetical_protein n=1 Tax=Hexamita inflata TaxID=28002 RepID=A0ABP1J507_9EUKA
MSIAQNAMQIERVECSEHLKTSGIRSIFSKCKIWTVFVHDLQYDQLQIQGSIMVYAVRYDHEFNCQFLSSQTSYTSITQQHALNSNALNSGISPEECTTYDLLNEEVKRALEQISLDIINHLIDSMPKRLEEVIKQKGDATKH